MVREKLEFSVQLHPGAVAGQLKAGQTLIVRPPASQEPGAAKVVECCSTEGSFLGDVPANAQNRLQGLGEVQASIRSVKRDAQGELASLLLRVEFGEDGAPLHPQDKGHSALAGLVGLPTEPRQQQQPQQQPLPYVVDDDGFQLRRSQLEQLVYSPELNLMLKDNSLQGLLTKIDGSGAKREQVLESALQGPAFAQFADKVLELLDRGLPPTVQRQQ